jgi:hypothetical protein
MVQLGTSLDTTINKMAKKKVKKKTQKVYNVFYYDKDDELIDQTQIDEKSAKLAWELFKEFGHTKKKGTYLEWEEDEEEVDEDDE